MTVQKRHHLPGHLQIWHIPVQINPVQALHIQRHMPIKQIIHPHHIGHRHSMPAPHPPDQPQARRSEAKPRWETAE